MKRTDERVYVDPREVIRQFIAFDPASWRASLLRTEVSSSGAIMIVRIIRQPDLTAGDASPSVTVLVAIAGVTNEDVFIGTPAGSWRANQGQEFHADIDLMFTASAASTADHQTDPPPAGLDPGHRSRRPD